MRSSWRSLPLLVATGAVALAACGGGDGTADEAVLPAAGDTAEAGEPAAGPVAPEALLATQVDLFGTEVVPAAEIESNLLPPVILDDLTTGRQVNFRNLIPQDKPVLLWMYAPH